MGRLSDAGLSDLPLFSAAATHGTVPGVPDDVCAMFERTALAVKRRGFDKYSARAIFHRLRWEAQIEHGNRDFKVNNVWSAPLARWVMARHPHMAGFFELRGD